MAKSRKTPSLFDAPDTDASVPPPPTGGTTEGVALHEAAQSRYLNYALSVITSRALPDVRDGLKPVQRRILYTMWQQSLTADAKHRKCAKVVGDVMGSYHPHGDAAIYDTLVRMAQPFSLRYPLVDGQGNFGSPGNDPPAAMRYCVTGESLVRLPFGQSVRIADVAPGARLNSDSVVDTKVMDRNGNPVVADRLF